jgi:ABC-2 type transport system permease protein
MAASEALYPVKDHSWRQGLGTLIRKENSAWWGTRKWWVQSIVWLVIINGLFALILWAVPSENPEEVPSSSEVKEMFIIIFSVFTTIGAIVLSQSAIVGEKQSGTAEWIMSNPVSRSAFVLAKFVAYGFAILIILVVLQSTVFYGQLSLYDGVLISPGPFVKAVILVSLNLIYFLALTLMLGTFFSSRVPVVGIPIGVLIGQDIVASLLGEYMPWLREIMPQKTMEFAQMVLEGEKLTTFIPLVVIVGTTILFMVLAMWRFERQEF